MVNGSLWKSGAFAQLDSLPMAALVVAACVAAEGVEVLMDVLPGPVVAVSLEKRVGEAVLRQEEGVVWVAGVVVASKPPCELLLAHAISPNLSWPAFLLDLAQQRLKQFQRKGVRIHGMSRKANDC